MFQANIIALISIISEILIIKLTSYAKVAASS